MANEKKFEVAGNVSIVSAGKTVVQKEEFEKVLDDVHIGGGETVNEMYDRLSRLLYVIDSSGSMAESMMDVNDTKPYDWTKPMIEELRLAIKMENPNVGLDSEEAEQYEYPEDIPEDEALDVDAMSDQEVKVYALTHGQQDHYRNVNFGGVKIPYSGVYGRKKDTRTKMQALKEAARNFVKQRFLKFPEALVSIFSFEDRARLISQGPTEQAVLAAIDSLPDFGGGGTNIYEAVSTAVNECKQRPSEVGLHHIVLVSDGMDGGATRCQNLLERMKSTGIVFDFIYMLGAGGDEGDHVIKVLKALCEATGGEFTIVRSEQDFAQKFLAVSSRPLLPASVK
jgi:von Willebrand factor type A domain